MADTTTHEQQQQEDQVIWSMPLDREVPTWALELVLARIAKVNRKAERLAVPPFTVTVGEPFVRTVTRINALGENEKVTHELVVITIGGEPVKVTGGFRFLGRVDFEDGAILVNPRPGEEIPPRYRKATTWCDHCESERRRSNVFIFRDDAGAHVQVGRSCLKDFMGHDPARVLHAISLGALLGSELDEEERGWSARRPDLIEVDVVLQMTARVMRANASAFVSRTASQATEGRVASTAGLVHEQLFPPTGRAAERFVQLHVEAEDIERAAAAKAWALEAMVKPEQSDYEYNLTTLLQQLTIQLRRIGMVVSLMGAYARHLGDLAVREKRVNGHVGVIGKRAEFDATFTGANSYDTQWGTTYIGRFDTAEGTLVYKGTAPFWTGSLREGAAVRLVATIKEHGEYKGWKQSFISRARILSTTQAQAAA